MSVRETVGWTAFAVLGLLAGCGGAPASRDAGHTDVRLAADAGPTIDVRAADVRAADVRAADARRADARAADAVRGEAPRPDGRSDALARVFDASAPDAPVRVVVTPALARVHALASQLFTANVPVTWSVSSGGGAIDASGLYVAPMQDGYATIQATSVADPKSSGYARVTILTPGNLDFVAGWLGGCGNLDGTGIAARFCRPRTMAYDGAGSLYVADTSNNAIRRVTIATGAVLTIAGGPAPGSADGIGPAAQFSAPNGLALDGVHGILLVADTGNDTLRSVDLATTKVRTLAGSAGIAGSADGVGAAAAFSGPSGVTVNPSGTGTAFIADSGNGTLRAVDLATGTVTTLAGTLGTSGHVDAVGTAAEFAYPSALAFDGVGALYVSDGAGIRKVDLASKAVTTFVSSGAGGPDSLAYDTGGNLVATGYATVDTISLATGAQTEIFHGCPSEGPCSFAVAAVGTGTKVYTLVNDGLIQLSESLPYFMNWPPVAIAGAAPGAAGWQWSPVEYPPSSLADIAVGPGGEILATEPRQGSVDSIDLANGSGYEAAGGNFCCGGVYDPGPFHTPFGLAVLAKGGFLLSDGDDAIFDGRAGLSGRAPVPVLAGTLGMAGSMDGTGAAATLNYPEGVALDGHGSLLVTDTRNDTIRAIDLSSAAVTTLAGSPGLAGSVDGKGAVARFNHPASIASDGTGRSWVADSGNHTLRQIDLVSGNVWTLAGKTGVSGSSDGTGTSATFVGPQGIAYDGKGNLYVADGATVREVSVATGVVTTVAGVPGRQGIRPGALPATLNDVVATAVAADGDLLLADTGEGAILVIPGH